MCALLLWETSSCCHISGASLTTTCPPVQMHYEGGGSRTPATDVICPMYARMHQILQLADTPGQRNVWVGGKVGSRWETWM